MAEGNPSWGDCRGGGVLLLLPVPLSAWVLHEIHSRVPRPKRRWNEVTRIWWIHDNHIDTVEEILRRNYPNYDPYEGVG